MKYILIILSGLIYQSGDTNVIKELYVNDFDFGGSKDDFLYFAGEPDSTQTVYSEMNRKDYTIFTYSESSLTFLDDKLIGVEFKDSVFTLMPYKIKVGAKDEVLKATFPLSYKSRDGGDKDYVMVIAYYDTTIGFVVRNNCIVSVYTRYA